MTMHHVAIYFSLAVWAFAAYVAVVFYLQFRKCTGSLLDRFFKAAHDSGTILWTKFCVVLAAVTVQLDGICDLLGAPELKEFINQWVGNPRVISGVALTITAITYFARMRRSSVDPIAKS